MLNPTILLPMKKLVLGSNSPRRKELLSQAGFEFEVFTTEVDESSDQDLSNMDLAVYLARKKNLIYRESLATNVVLTADTVVISKENVLGKPLNRQEAVEMLKSMSDSFHKVITGVCISSSSKLVCFDDTTLVHFRKLTESEIESYVDKYQPYDKAGGYGIQEWIGMIAIDQIKGSYYNVMGLPIHKVYECLAKDFGIHAKL